MESETVRGLYSPFTSVRSFVHALVEPLSVNQKRLTPRPYNQYDPDQSLWWLVPSTEWPAYDRGKVVVFRETGGQIFVGLHVERGFHLKAVAANGISRRLAMDKTWLGSRFLDDMENGSLDHAASQVQARTGCLIRVQLTTPVPDTADLKRDPRPAERMIQWDWNDGLLTRGGEWDLPSELAGNLPNLTSFSAIAREVAGNSAWDWFWMNLFIGVLLSSAEQGEESPPQILNGDQIVRTCVEPWLAWVR
ncbi:MAG: hypothetical protein ACOY93_03765 [Bacillota bacterium]